MHIYLIGMPGAGKTTLGRNLAAQLGRTFLDLDEAIEEAAGKTIPQIFEEKGEAYFRELEAETLKTVSFSAEKLVVATGGGTPCFHQNMAFMHAHGLTVYLKVSPEVLAERLLASDLSARPLLKNKTKPLVMKYLRETLRERATFYEQAGIIFENPSVQLTAGASLAAFINRYESTA
ncbi:shikimate kinase [Adhaeribacter sp. BT258]|uniref:Shikimate kinase n=1 Tax=Adhaeribacter terrigena TaxID=2793070 RepID=A0ABS1C1V1_9BACT|nr:shikimate kinase [Adhaeribacter terrigena]MBK0403304.1 shikimate kinase [Adhaeribacter terrigena]